MVVLSLADSAVQSYIVYSAILALKVLILAPMTGVARITRGSFSSIEDTKAGIGGKVRFYDPVVERIRRAHRNDLENIVPFWVLGALYLTTGPVGAWATLLFRTFTIARIIHTIVYLIPFPQPSRALAYAVAILIDFYMAIQVMLHYATAI